MKLQLDATKILRNCSSVESLKYLQTILVKLINPTLRVVGFSSAQNLKAEKTCARTTIHFHPFFILLSADPDTLFGLLGKKLL